MVKEANIAIFSTFIAVGTLEAYTAVNSIKFWFVQGDYILSPIQFCHQILLSTEQNI
jgi:hypothetical protein